MGSKNYLGLNDQLPKKIKRMKNVFLAMALAICSASYAQTVSHTTSPVNKGATLSTTRPREAKPNNSPVVKKETTERTGSKSNAPIKKEETKPRTASNTSPGKNLSKDAKKAEYESRGGKGNNEPKPKEGKTIPVSHKETR